MRIEWSETFTKEHRRLSKDIQLRFEKQFRLFMHNPRYPSLRVKKMANTEAIFEARVTDAYRWTFEPLPDGIRLRRIGTHDILRRP